jgi:hypothetical protein
VYDDLGKTKDSRPPLGGSKALPYPRRLAISAPGKDNLPYGEALLAANLLLPQSSQRVLHSHWPVSAASCRLLIINLLQAQP